MLIAMENWTKVNKAAVSLLMAVLSWALYYWDFGASAENVSAFTKALGETSEILFFLMGAMAIVEVVDANGGFDFFRERLVSKSKVELLWKLTFITFFLSAVLDNMTTAIIMVTILDKMTSNRKDKLLYASMVILSANSGGAFSPIGDVTTIMLWVKGYISTFGVLRSLFLPSLVSVIIPAIIVSFFLKGKLETDEKPAAEDKREISRQSHTVFLIGVGGLLLVPVFRFVTGLPPFMGIMLILAVLWIVTDISLLLRKIDLSTILFFLGILSTVAVLSEIGVLKAAGNFLERVSEGNPYIVTTAIGFLSAIVDNVPLVAGCMGMYDVIASGAGAGRLLRSCVRALTT